MTDMPFAAVKATPALDLSIPPGSAEPRRRSSEAAHVHHAPWRRGGLAVAAHAQPGTRGP